MKLYKYIASESALKNIVSGRIKFATLDSLNDPTELLPKIYESELLKSLEEKRVSGYREDDLLDLERQESLFRKLSPETMVIPVPKSIEQANRTVKLPVYNNLDYLKKMFNKTVDLMASRCGILCLSTRYDSLPMWAHYANNALGYVIEFEDLQSVYSGDETGVLNEIKDIDYKNKRSGITFDKGSYNSLFFEKNKDWEYESEKRVVTDLKSCIEHKIAGEVIYIQEIDKQYFSKVIFGWKVPESAIARLSEEVLSINIGVTIATATIKDGLIKIDN
ncbi:MAG: DUF2971 domain-containing protein [Gammaproteobacteria bacterium]|nr:DUF2971 domain-containing protein [Gammaproteobacteria bacterium]